MLILTVIINLCFVIDSCRCMIWGPDRGGDRCEAAMRETILADRGTAADDTPSRLHGTWLSQGCETRHGPDYIIRKYTFHENGTFLLLRHHYAEDSCSIATHTVTARGILRLLLPSILTPGATEARFRLDTVHVIPLNRQVAQKLGRRMNASCGPQPRWRPYVPQLVYEHSMPHGSSSPTRWEGPRYNSLQGHPASRGRRGIDCLELLGIEFGELRLIRVQKRPSASAITGAVIRRKIAARPRIELLLGSLPPDLRSRFTHRPTGLQSSSLLRVDTINGCPTCNAISRGTESSPPVLHEVAALPALLGGSWLSTSCESLEGGLWIKRQLRVWPGDKLWTGRWDHYADPRCSAFLYATTAAGSYVQRAGRPRRHHRLGEDNTDDNDDDGDDDASESLLAEYRKDNWPERVDNLRSTISDDRARSRRDVVSWMTPELAKNIWDIYATKRDETPAEEMLPTIDEIREAIARPDERPNGSETNDDDEVSSNNPGDVREGETFRRHSRGQMRSRNTHSRRNFKRSLEEEEEEEEENYPYRHLLSNAQRSLAESFTAMLRGNQRHAEPTRLPVPTVPAPASPPPPPPTPTGTTELDLHVAESILIPGDASVAARCGGRGQRLTSWPRDCVPHAIEAPATLGLRARVGVTWSGEYELLLGPRDGSSWDTALRQCGPTPDRNSELRSHLRTSVGLRYGLFNPSFSTSSIAYSSSSSSSSSSSPVPSSSLTTISTLRKWQLVVSLMLPFYLRR